MRYPIAIEPGTETTARGVVAPDLPAASPLATPFGVHRTHGDRGA